MWNLSNHNLYAALGALRYHLLSTEMVTCSLHDCKLSGLLQTARLRAMAIRSSRPFIDFQAMEVASKWLVRLLEHWTSLLRLRLYHKVGETARTPGSLLATMVCKHMRRLFSDGTAMHFTEPPECRVCNSWRRDLKKLMPSYLSVI